METCYLTDIFGSTDGILPALGEYHILSIDTEHPIAVSTLGDCELPDILAERKPRGLSIVGKTETENIGIEKIIQNTLATPTLKYLILCGKDSSGHFSGQTILSLFEHGVNDRMRIIGAKGRRPVLANTSAEDVEAFRKQIEVIDMIDCTDSEKIIQKIEELASKEAALPKELFCAGSIEKKKMNHIKIITAKVKDPNQVKLDRAGYFVIIPKADQGIILVEHYNYANQLLRIIQGDNARDIYWTIIENNWIGEMSHAAYLGKELTAAQLSMQLGFKYVQDKA